jgi:hypothetical protein
MIDGVGVSSSLFTLGLSCNGISDGFVRSQPADASSAAPATRNSNLVSKLIFVMPLLE